MRASGKQGGWEDGGVGGWGRNLFPHTLHLPTSPHPDRYIKKLNTFEIILLIWIIFPKIYQVRA